MKGTVVWEPHVMQTAGWASRRGLLALSFAPRRRVVEDVKALTPWVFMVGTDPSARHEQWGGARNVRGSLPNPAVVVGLSEVCR